MLSDAPSEKPGSWQSWGINLPCTRPLIYLYRLKMMGCKMWASRGITTVILNVLSIWSFFFSNICFSDSEFVPVELCCLGHGDSRFDESMPSHKKAQRAFSRFMLRAKRLATGRNQACLKKANICSIWLNQLISKLDRTQFAPKWKKYQDIHFLAGPVRVQFLLTRNGQQKLVLMETYSLWLIFSHLRPQIRKEIIWSRSNHHRNLTKWKLPRWHVLAHIPCKNQSWHVHRLHPFFWRALFMFVPVAAFVISYLSPFKARRPIDHIPRCRSNL